MSRIISDKLWGILTVWQEARGEVYLGKVAVAEVIIRRTQSRYSSDGSISSTVLWPYQFSGWNTKDPNRIASVKVDRWDPVMMECIQAWKEAEEGSNYTKGAVLYYNPKVCTPVWAKSCKVVAEIDHHLFLVPLEGAKI